MNKLYLILLLLFPSVNLIAQACTPQYTRARSIEFTLKGENSSFVRKLGYTTNIYHDYTSSNNVTLAKGKTYGALLNLSDTMNSFDCWIDFNDDGAFSSNEKIVNNFRWRMQQYIPLNIYIPLSAPTGIHKLRLRTNSNDQCAYYYEGQAHDYTVTITEANTGSSYDVSTGSPNTCVNGGNLMINSESNNNNIWLPLTDTSNNIIASINANGNNLGRVNVYEYINSSTPRSNAGKPYLDRNFQIAVENQPLTNVSVRLYLLKTEYDALKAADPSIKSLMDLWLTKTAQACGSTIGAGLLIQPVASGTTGNGYYIEYSIPAFSSFYLQSAPSALPIVMSSLKGNRLNNSNHLSWTTQSEQDNLGFEIEVSTDGIDFNKIAFVESKAANGNSSATLSYSFADGKSYLANTYYRLKQITKDGKSVYGNIVMIQGVPSQLQITSVFPNPVTSSVTLNLYSPVYEKVSIAITTTSGKSLLSKTFVLEASANNIKLNTSSLPSGTYFIKAVTAVSGVQTVSKFVKL